MPFVLENNLSSETRNETKREFYINFKAFFALKFPTVLFALHTVYNFIIFYDKERKKNEVVPLYSLEQTKKTAEKYIINSNFE